MHRDNAGQENDHIRMALFYGVLQSRSIVVQIVQHHLRRPTGHATVSHGGIFALQCLFQEGCVRDQLIVSRHSGRQRIPKREHTARRERAVFGIRSASSSGGAGGTRIRSNVGSRHGTHRCSGRPRSGVGARDPR